MVDPKHRAFLLVASWRVGRSDEDGLVGLELVDQAGSLHAFAMPASVAEKLSETLAVQAHQMRAAQGKSRNA